MHLLTKWLCFECYPSVRQAVGLPRPWYSPGAFFTQPLIKRDTVALFLFHRGGGWWLVMPIMMTVMGHDYWVAGCGAHSAGDIDAAATNAAVNEYGRLLCLFVFLLVCLFRMILLWWWPTGWLADVWCCRCCCCCCCLLLVLKRKNLLGTSLRHAGSQESFWNWNKKLRHPDRFPFGFDTTGARR